MTQPNGGGRATSGATQDAVLRAAVRELIFAGVDMHPVYGNTAACSGGIGGASVTAHCAELCPSPKHDAARERHEAAVRRLARWLEGVPLDA
jgi:hypothetical protein